MNILRLSTLSLTLALAFITLGYVNPSSANKPDSKGNHDHGEPGTFSVTVFFEPLPIVEHEEATKFAGSETGFVGNSKSGGHFRTGLGERKIMLNLDLMDTAQLCGTSFGAPTGNFAIETARHTEDGEFTFVAVSFFGFKAEGVSYWVDFDPDVFVSDNWYPAPQSTNTRTGSKIGLGVTKGPTKDGPCNGIIMQNWKMDVKNEAPV